MSLRDLRQLGVLLPREEWGQHDLRTTVNKRALTIVMIVGVAGLTLMYVGDGNALTFGGVGLFMVFMWRITRISLAAIEVQTERFRETREDIRSGDGGEGGNDDEVRAADGPSGGH